MSAYVAEPLTVHSADGDTMVVDSNGITVAHVNPYMSRARREEYARLFAVAPDLLAILRKGVTRHEDSEEGFAWRDRARALIARIEGDK
jgi:hypothetical protein